VTEQPTLDFAGLLRQLREQALLTQEELADAAGLSPRAVSDLERGFHRTARRDTAVLLADALGLTGSARDLFVAAALGRAPAADVLAADSGLPGARGGVAGRQAGVQRPLGALIESPYRGLKAFREQDAGFFFGREVASAQVIERMGRLMAGGGVLVVSGVSGAGKSSLLAAGVLPQIREAGLAATPQAAWWPCQLFTPTHAPLDELALRTATLARVDAAMVRRGLDADPAGFALTARQAAQARPAEPAQDLDGSAEPLLEEQRLLLVVDQFEELFTQCDDEQQRRAFITALDAAATGRGPGQVPAALVVLGVRADFEAHCADHPQLVDAIQDRYLVTAMTERQLRMAITEPAKKAGGAVDEDLAGVLLAEVRNGQPGTFAAGVLPLLSHALDQAWRSGTGDKVTLADYERTGGMEGAVAASAQRAYDGLTHAQQAAARQVFLRLIATSSDGADSADRATRADLTAGKTVAETADVEAVLEAFAAERLLTLAAGTVELSHEVLLTAWPLLRDTWLADTHSDRIVRTRLQNTAAEWDQHARDHSYLYTGTLLHTATGTAARITADPARQPPLGQAETDFLHASDRAHHRRARRRQAVIAGLVVLTLIAFTAAGIAVHNAATTSHQHAIALSRQLAAESLGINGTDPVVARRLAVAAWRVFPTAQAGSAINTLLSDQQQNGMLPADTSQAWGVAFSPDGKLLASASLDGTVRLWNPATRQPVGAPLRVTSTRYGVYNVAFSPDGKLLATADSDGTVRLFNPATRQSVGAPIHATTGRSIAQFLKTTFPGGVLAVAFSPTGKLLATADGNNTVRLFNPATGRPVGTPLRASARYGVLAVAFSPDGKLLASAGADGTVRLWNPATGRPVGTRLRASAPFPVIAVAFSPDGKLLASADFEGVVRLWNPATGQPVGKPIRAGTGSNPELLGVAFSPDGKLLASAGNDGTVRLWNPATGQQLGAPLHAPNRQDPAHSVAFSPNGKLLASGETDGTVRLWNPATRRPAGAPLHAASAPYAAFGVTFSPDGKLLASSETDGTVRLWNPATGQPVGTPLQTGSGPSGGVNAVTFSPDGKLLASADRDGTVWLWSTATGRPVRSPIHATSAKYIVYEVAFSPGGKLLASADGDGTVRLWNPATGQPVGAPLHASAHGGVYGVTFSPNGKLLASADADNTVRLWNPATHRPVGAPLRASTVNGVEEVRFSPDGKLLATAGDDGTVRLFNPATGQPVGAPLHASALTAGFGAQDAEFSPDGKLLASSGEDGTVRLWNPATGQPVSPPIQAGAQTTLFQVTFSPDGKLLASADADGTVRLWQVSLFTHPYVALCTDVGPPTRQEWNHYASGEAQPSVCP
jgi:WD40 repeat protein/transcriptional regulator with XRE-family HTH domain